MQTITREKANLKLEFNPNSKPLGKVEIGETVVFETANNFALYHDILSDDDVVDFLPLIGVNPCTGPVWVEGAQPGDTLVVEVLDVSVAERGHICLMPKVGILQRYTKSPHTKVFRMEGGMTYLNEDLAFPTQPVIGTIGTTPAVPVPTIMPGPHAGNLDDPNIKVGSRLHLPVFVPGALFMVGDVHANQGDSEICMGVECDGTVTLKFVELIKGKTFPTTIVETPTHWDIPGYADNLPEAIEMAAKTASDFIMLRTGATREEACYVMCAVGNVRLSQAALAGYPVTVRAEIPKEIDRQGRLRSAWG